MSDELARWAARRAPDLIARAEADAIAELRRALVDAATGRRRAAPPAPAQEPPAEDGELLWAYGVTRATAEPATLQSSVGGEGPVERLDHHDLALLVSRVPRAGFTEEALRRNLNDLAWLERVARSHEAVLEAALEDGPVVPLRLCTIFDGSTGAQRMLDGHADALREALDALEGRQEWSVKLLVDSQALLAAGARARGSTELGPAGSGAAYMLRRRAERQDREAADQLAAGIADDVHARLQDWAAGAVLRPAQNRDLSGHEGEMLLNGAYLVETAKLPELRALIEELRERHAELGARIELSGPFPAYNFVPTLDA
jgi:hypothetical protein